MPIPRLYVILDYDFVGDKVTWLSTLNQLIRATSPGDLLIQVRAKQLSQTEFLELARQARDLVPKDIQLVLNGDSELAMRLGYDGVHYPEASMKKGGGVVPNLFTTAAVHSLASIEVLSTSPIDALVLSPVFEPSWKAASALGIDCLRGVVERCEKPVFALGGISVDRVRECLDVGAHGIAVLSGVIGTPNKIRAMETYFQALRRVSEC